MHGSFNKGKTKKRQSTENRQTAIRLAERAHAQGHKAAKIAQAKYWHKTECLAEAVVALLKQRFP